MLQLHNKNEKRRNKVSNQNEIDDILNEIKNKKASADGDLPKRDNFTNDTSFNLNTTQKSDKKLNLDNNFDIINDSFAQKGDDNMAPKKKKSKNKKKIAIIIAAVAVAAAIICAVIFAVAKNSKPEETTAPKTTVTTSTTAAPTPVLNPLTGESSFNENAVGKRPVAIVVENAYAARPQWGIDDSKAAPDIIVEGEVEGGETRMLWLYADYTALPDQVGPVRSARPPFIRFSELFDSIFIHWGQSSSRGNYIGADTVFQQDDVDHINEMAYSDKVGLFGRDSSRGVSSEHTGVLYGNALEAAIDDLGFRTDIDEDDSTKFSFNEEATAVSDVKCDSFTLTFSSRTKSRDWTYSEDDKMYHCSDYLTDVARTNLLVLYDDTEYVAKDNYKGSGKAEVYCDYKLSGGSGKLVSLGTVADIEWSVSDGVLVIKDQNGETVNLNPGKTWIGYASSNNGGTDKNNTSVG